MSLLLLLLAVSGTAANVAPCLQAQAPIAAGEVVTISGFLPIDCPRRAVPALRYDAQSGVTHAAVALRRGDIVRRWPGAEMPIVRPGDPLLLRVQIGAVAVSRDVVALQGGQPGRRLFVQDGEGRVFSIRLAAQ